MSDINDDIFNIEKIFPEPFRVFEKDKSTLEEAKEDSLIVLDTNILLFPYTVSTHSLSSIENIYKKLVDDNRLFIPSQVSREFAKNRNQKLGEMYHSIINHNNKFTKIKRYPIIENLPEYNDVLDNEKELETVFNSYDKKLKKLAQAIKNMERNDPVSLIYYNIFKRECIVNHKKNHNDIKKDLEFRIKSNVPPGFKDKNKTDFGVGDLIIWHTILSLGEENKKSLIFVSNDEKSDWYNQSNGNAFQPRYELIDEYKRASDGNSLFIINFSTFLKLFEIDKKASMEIEKKEFLNFSFIRDKSSFYKDYENKKEEIKEWFYDNYDDPANLLPFDSREGGFIEIYGSIEPTKDIIEQNFGGDIPEKMIEEIVQEIEHERDGCDFWSPQAPNGELYLNIMLDYETGERCGAGGFQVISIENDETGEDLTKLIDVGHHYFDIEDLKSDISTKTGINSTLIECNIV